MTNNQIFRAMHTRITAKLILCTELEDEPTKEKCTISVGTYTVRCFYTVPALERLQDRYSPNGVQRHIRRCAVMPQGRLSLAPREPLARLATRYPEDAQQFLALEAV